MGVWDAEIGEWIFVGAQAGASALRMDLQPGRWYLVVAWDTATRAWLFSDWFNR
jgi:hypothetical protein